MKIFVKAKPAAKEDKIEKLSETHFTISVTEPPVQGKANRAIAKIISDYFKVPPSQVKLVSGFSSKQKIFEIEKL